MHPTQLRIRKPELWKTNKMFIKLMFVYFSISSMSRKKVLKVEHFFFVRRGVAYPQTCFAKQSNKDEKKSSKKNAQTIEQNFVCASFGFFDDCALYIFIEYADQFSYREWLVIRFLFYLISFYSLDFFQRVLHFISTQWRC